MAPCPRLAEKLKKLGLSESDEPPRGSPHKPAAHRRRLTFQIFFPLPPFDGIHFNALKAGTCSFNFTGLLLGVGGKQLQEIKQKSSARVEVVNARGNLKGTHPDPLDADLHALITADSVAKLKKAADLICRVMSPTNASYEPICVEPGGSARLVVAQDSVTHAPRASQPKSLKQLQLARSPATSINSSSGNGDDGGDVCRPRFSLDASSNSSNDGSRSRRSSSNSSSQALPPSPILLPVTPASTSGCHRPAFAGSCSSTSSCCSSRAPTPSPQTCPAGRSGGMQSCREGRRHSGDSSSRPSLDGGSKGLHYHLHKLMLPPAALVPVGPQTPLAMEWPALPSSQATPSTSPHSSRSSACCPGVSEIDQGSGTSSSRCSSGLAGVGSVSYSSSSNSSSSTGAVALPCPAASIPTGGNSAPGGTPPRAIASQPACTGEGDSFVKPVEVTTHAHLFDSRAAAEQQAEDQCTSWVCAGLSCSMQHADGPPGPQHAPAAEQQALCSGRQCQGASPAPSVLIAAAPLAGSSRQVATGSPQPEQMCGSSCTCLVEQEPICADTSTAVTPQHMRQQLWPELHSQQQQQQPGLAEPPLLQPQQQHATSAGGWACSVAGGPAAGCSQGMPHSWGCSSMPCVPPCSSWGWQDSTSCWQPPLSGIADGRLPLCAPHPSEQQQLQRGPLPACGEDLLLLRQRAGQVSQACLRCSMQGDMPCACEAVGPAQLPGAPRTVKDNEGWAADMPLCAGSSACWTAESCGPCMFQLAATDPLSVLQAPFCDVGIPQLPPKTGVGSSRTSSWPALRLVWETRVKP